MAWKINCPKCGRFISFPVRDGLDDKAMSKKLSLFLHGKRQKCNGCDAIVILTRVVGRIETFDVKAKYAVPLYDKAGKQMAVMDSTGAVRGEAEVVR